METLLGVYEDPCTQKLAPFHRFSWWFSEFHIKPAENAIKQILYDISVQNDRDYIAATFTRKEMEI